jgi:hypothetical protein
MDNIIEATIDFDFSKLYLGPPSSITGGAYFTKIFYNSKPLYIQTPKSLTKQGFIKSGKKIYTDLMFDNNDTIFVNWIENLETKCQDLIYEKGDKWFETKLEKNDIETAFTSPLKVYKSGKFYLLRSNVKSNIKVYNDSDEPILIEDIKPETNLISILEIQGIKFTSRNFQIEIEVKQSLVVSPDPFLDSCFIKKPVVKENHSGINTNIIEPQPLAIVNAIVNSETINNNNNSNKVNTLEEHLDLEEQTKRNTEANTSKSTINVTNNNSVLTITEDDNIKLDFEDLNKEEQIEVNDPNELKEVDLSKDLENTLETITLKKPNQVYYEIYKAAREKAKEAKKAAVIAYLEAKNIKKTYMLDDIDDSDDSDLEEDSDFYEDSEYEN